jgi:endonuclease YncB( thermonuclease family)
MKRPTYIPLCVLILLACIIAWVALAQDGIVLEQKPIAIDGDTILLQDGASVRLVDYDAPEISQPNCPAEEAKGYEALGRLTYLIRRRQVRLERLSGLDKYRRVLGRLWVGQEPVSAVLIRQGLAVAYNGRTRRVHWAQTLCGLSEPKAAYGGYLPDR